MKWSEILLCICSRQCSGESKRFTTVWYGLFGTNSRSGVLLSRGFIERGFVGSDARSAHARTDARRLVSEGITWTERAQGNIDHRPQSAPGLDRIRSDGLSGMGPQVHQRHRISITRRLLFDVGRSAFYLTLLFGSSSRRVTSSSTHQWRHLFSGYSPTTRKERSSAAVNI